MEIEAFHKHDGAPGINDVAGKIRRQLKPEILSELAQHRLVLPDWVGKHKGSRKYVTIAGKC